MSSNMMASLAQAYPPHQGGMPQHTGISQGHPMSHNPSHPGQSGSGLPQQLHMGISAPGPPVTQGQAMMAGMSPGPGGPSAHALQHLSPGQQQQAQAQAQMFQHQAMFASNPQLQQMHQHQQQVQLLAHQRQQQAQRQAMMAQQYSGMPMSMPNGIPAMTQAQFQAMRGQAGLMRPVSLPQHLQAQQQQAEHSLQQQQVQAQHQNHQQQMLIAQQLAIQQQANAQSQGASNQGQTSQINHQPNQNSQQTQNALMQQHHQQQQQQQQAHGAASQQNQGQQNSQAQSQPNHSNLQNGPIQPTPQPQVAGVQHHITNAMMQQQHLFQQQQLQRHGERLKGQCLMKLMLFADHLSSFTSSTNSSESYMTNPSQRLAAQGAKQRDDLNYWSTFVEHFFSPRGVLRHSVWVMDEKSNKQYEITFPALPRYFHTHFESGIKGIQMILEKGTEKELPNNNHYIESQKSSFVYWFEGGAQLVASGTIKAHFDAQQKIELLEFVTTSHEEYLPRTQVVEAARPLHIWGKEWHKINSAPDGKSSPEMNKKKPKLMKSPPQPPPDIGIPASKVKTSMGITHSVFRFLELAEVMIQMNPLFAYSHQNPKISPSNALDQYVANVNSALNSGHPQIPIGSRTPAMANFTMGASPAQAQIQLPGGSPHIGSPAQALGTQFQNSHHGTGPSGPSVNTSPNSNNKRRRPSAVKNEEETQINGMHQNSHIKPSPRIGGKRQKGNPV
ncbi:Transcriptional activator ptaB [Golovinomyces cichoracearum]|uniref:Transcriptional activator ptaB n=1 Tax=Golovinomyces cichoracearum TaxID=62708 RepID=A0A420JB45_9PEZI|nr:Transcriptional activator ptaB [Golovinomyces cichoracearum]